MISIGNSLPSFRRRDELDPRADLLRQRFRRASRAVRDQPFRESFRNDVLYLLPEEFIAAVSELLLRLNIQQHDLSGLGSPPPWRPAPLPAARGTCLPSAPDASPLLCAR